MKSHVWKKSEGGIVGRFGDPRKSLRDVALTLADNDIDATVQSFLVDQGSSLAQLKLRLYPRVENIQLQRLSPAAVSCLGVSIILRDPSMKVHKLLSHWKLGELPESIPLDDLPHCETIVQDKLTLSVGLTALEDADTVKKGTTFARKDFIIQTSVAGSQFPHSPVPPSYFETLGLPKTTAWFIQIKDETGDESPSETFEVLINNELLPKLGSGSNSDAIWAALVSDTLLVLMSTLLRNTVSNTPAQGSILYQLSRQISSQGYTVENVAEWLRNGESGKLLTLAQAITRATKIIGGTH